MAPVLAVHGHFYQPPRENPWTEEVAREASAAPFHDWNARITAECYRPNGWARIVDDAGRVEAIVNNYELLSFNMGPTLLAWMERHAPDAYRRILDADAATGAAIAQAYGHVILPLASPRDLRTQVRWGLADFEHRFGRPAAGMWLPETAVNDDVLAVLVEEGVAFTILAPAQAAAIRPLSGEEDDWSDVEPGRLDIRRPYCWRHPDGRTLTLVFYDGGLSHDLAFGLGGLSSEAFAARVAASGDGLLAVATDGETFGHHHRWGERMVAHALTVAAPAKGVEVTTLTAWLRTASAAPTHEARVHESAWSCAHGVGRWREDCGCSTGGQHDWNQRWRAPLREALDLLRDAAAEVFERRGSAVLRDPWAARDAYAGVLLGRVGRDDFAGEHVTGDRVEAFTLLECQRHAMAMFTSCGWFFNDLAGLETVQVLRYAARVLDLLVELGEGGAEEPFLELLGKAESNDPAEGNGRDIWARRVLPARVDARRVVAHLALRELLEDQAPAERVASFEVEVLDHAHADRGTLALSTGHVRLTHRRTGRVTEHVYAGVHLGGLEAVGATRAAEPERDAGALAVLRDSFSQGATVTTLLRLLGEGFGPDEFGLESALPDAAEQIVESAASALTDRFAQAYARLFEDHQHTLVALARAGYQLPPELRAPGELALARRLEDEIAAQGGSLDPARYAAAASIARQARAAGVALDTPGARARLTDLLERAVEAAVAEPSQAPAAEGVLAVAADLGIPLDVERAQEVVYAALVGAGGAEAAELRRLGAALHLAVDRLTDHARG